MGYSFSNFYYPCFQILVSVSVQSWFQLIVLLIMENNANVFLLLCMSSNLWLNVRHLECYLVGYWIFSYSHILENCSRIDKLFRNSLNHSVLLLWSVCDVQSNVCVCVCSVTSDSVTPWTVACQAPLSMEFSRQGHWSGLPFPTPGKWIFPTQGLSPCLLYCNSQDLQFSLQHAGSLVVAWGLLVVACRI